MYRIRGRLLVLFACMVACLCAGCAGQQVNLWPAYTRNLPTEPEKREKGIETHRALGPLVVIETGPEQHYHAVRPIYNYESNPELRRLQYLWPLGVQYDRRGDVWQHRLLPVFSHWRGPETGRSSGFVFPILWWGSTPAEGPYFAVFPLGGVTHQVLGETWSCVGFPVFSYYRQRQYRRYDALWPIFTVGGTPDGRVRVRRVWPLYVHKRCRGEYDRYYVLWPFVRWGREQLDSAYPHHFFQFWPFYARKEAVSAEGETVAYHRQYFFYGVRRDTRPRQRMRGWSLFWYLIRFREAPTEAESRILPFYWASTWYRSRDRNPDAAWTRYRLLWPVVWLDYNRRETGVRERNIVVAPFYWDYRRAFVEQDGRTAREVTLWPLTTLDWDREGSFRFWILSHGWDDPPEGFKRIYSPLIDLFHYHSLADGRRETELLWGLYSHHRGPRGRYLGLLPFFTYDTAYRDGNLEKRVVSLLFGLVQYSARGDESDWRLFYLPTGE
ncbi:MAG: hypothetical protein V5A84_02430 [Planctomycetota bacterium]